MFTSKASTIYKKNPVFLLQKVAFCAFFVELQNENDFFETIILLFTK